MDDPADLINVALEELAKERFELPPFATLDKAAHHVQAITMWSNQVCISLHGSSSNKNQHRPH